MGQEGQPGAQKGGDYDGIKGMAKSVAASAEDWCVGRAVKVGGGENDSVRKVLGKITSYKQSSTFT